MLRPQIGLQHWKIWMLRWKLVLSEKQLENIKISAKESLGYYELRQHKPWFDEGCSELLDQRKRVNCSGYRIQAK
jgi:hypothetical protein